MDPRTLPVYTPLFKQWTRLFHEIRSYFEHSRMKSVAEIPLRKHWLRTVLLPFGWRLARAGRGNAGKEHVAGKQRVPDPGAYLAW